MSKHCTKPMRELQPAMLDTCKSQDYLDTNRKVSNRNLNQTAVLKEVNFCIGDNDLSVLTAINTQSYVHENTSKENCDNYNYD